MSNTYIDKIKLSKGTDDTSDDITYNIQDTIRSSTEKFTVNGTLDVGSELLCAGYISSQGFKVDSESISLGEGTQSLAVNCNNIINIGQNNTINGWSNVILLGNSLTASNDYQMSLGKYNKTSNKHILFDIGDGKADAPESVLIIDRAGNPAGKNDSYHFQFHNALDIQSSKAIEINKQYSLQYDSENGQMSIKFKGDNSQPLSYNAHQKLLKLGNFLEVVNNQQNQIVLGQYNSPQENALLIIGNGTTTTRNNILEIYNDNTINLNGTVSCISPSSIGSSGVRNIYIGDKSPDPNSTVFKEGDIYMWIASETSATEGDES